MEAERDAAEKVKRDEPILVVIGNPPYNAFAGVSPVEEDGLVEPYKEGLISECRARHYPAYQTDSNSHDRFDDGGGSGIPGCRMDGPEPGPTCLWR